MNILVVANLYPSAADPAFGSFVSRRVDALRAAGACVDVIAIRGSRGHLNPLRYVDLVLRSWATGAWRLLTRRRYAVVEAHIAYPTGLIGLPVARLHRAHLVVFVHGSDVTRLATRSPTHRRMAGALLRMARLVVANSEFMARRTRELAPRLGDRVVVWSPGIDATIFHAAPANRRTGLLFVGRLMAEKGVDVLIRALADVRSRTPVPALTVVGHGPERPLLDQLAAELSVEVVFAGVLPPSRVAKAMREAAIVVVPSTYEEPLGLVAIEALASGALVVITDGGGLPEAVSGSGRAIIVSRGSVTALAAGIERALAMTEADGGHSSPSPDVAVDRHDARRVARDSLAWYRALG